jgi:hypothetical protein
METIDLTKVAEILNPDNKRLSYDKHKHLFTKVAFDVFQLNSSPVESYWLLEQGDDGEEYLVANYEREIEKEEIKVTSSWEALSDKDSKNVTLLYKGVPIRRFASSEFSFNADDVHLFRNTLVNKLRKDSEFKDKMMDTLSDSKKSALLETFPELA